MSTNDQPLPDHLSERPKTLRDWPLPTAWLLGTKLLGSMRDILLSSVAKVDLRTWMTAGNVIDRTEDTTVDENEEECCYIDFLADTGDAQRLVFQLARLLRQRTLEVKTWKHGKEIAQKLPRGSMLILGGDIGYPVSTHRRLLDRIRAPFKWAHDELSDEDRAHSEANPVTLLAVPGNHDYYDGLRGFEAMFHAPPVHPIGASSEDIPPSRQPLRLPGYKLEQHASYFAAALPFDWRLWGLDVENAVIDDRQRAYFEWSKTWTRTTGEQKESPKPQTPTVASPPKRLIVVTSRPAFVYQGLSDHAKVLVPTMERLGLTPAFQKNGDLGDKEGMRLDLSGDVHVYERYWGADHETMPDDLDGLAALSSEKRQEMADYEPPERYAREDSKGKRRRGNDDASRAATGDRPRYASVVSGLGGTFHHPSQVRMGETPPRTVWPSAEHSAREIGIRLADPSQMFRAGAVGIVGMLVAVACYFLIWKSEPDAGAPVANVLDVPFALPQTLLADHKHALCQLGLVAAMVGVIAVMIALPIIAYLLGRRLSTPIREMRRPTHWWPRVTKWITHDSPVRFLLHLAGANARSAWMFLTNIAPVVGTVVGIWYLYALLRYLDSGVDGLVAVYSLITLIVIAMGALGALRAGEKTRSESWGTNICRRFIYLLFGVVIGLLVVWTPYAWVRLISRNEVFGVLGIAIIFLTMFLRFGRTVFPRRLGARRAMTALGLVLLVAGAVVIPICFAGMDGTPVENPHPRLSLLLAALLGAYFACLWVGWYFCIALQWNAHGNEAGGAARITDYGEFLRIKLTAKGAEVWAIAVEERLQAKPGWYHRLFKRKLTNLEELPTARVIDHFTLRDS